MRNLYLYLTALAPAVSIYADETISHSIAKELAITVLWLCLTLGFLYWGSNYLKTLKKHKNDKQNEDHQIKLIENRIINQKLQLYLVEFEDKKILFSQTHEGITKLSETTKKPNFDPWISKTTAE